MKNRKNKWWLLGLTLWLGVISILYLAALPTYAAKEQTVRVGFFEFEGYHMINDQGRRSGYGYDYLQYLARYTNFSYEYIGYDKSWSEMQKMLENGEIDLLTSARKSEDRLEQFDFSQQPIGRSMATLTVKAGDDRYVVSDYKGLDGIRVGLLEGNSRNKDLENFARENGFTYQPVYFNDVLRLEEALQEGREIDAILSSNLRKIKGEWVVATFDATPFYIMVRKGDSRLLEQVNDGIAKVSANYPNLTTMLYERYYSAKSGDEIAYTPEEREYIEDWKKGGQPIKVTVNSGREPVSYFEEGKAKGIIPEIAMEVMGRTGLPYEFVETKPTTDARILLANEDVLVRFDGASDFSEAEDYGFRVTEPYLKLPLSCVTLKNLDREPETVAVIQNSDVVEKYVERAFGDASITRYASAKECLNAVLTGKQDAAFFQTYIAQKFVAGDVRNRLKEQLVPGYELNFAVSVRQDNPILFSILDKAVQSLDSEEIDGIIFAQTSYLAGEKSLLSYLYEHPVLWLLILAAAACFVIIVMICIFRKQKLNLEQEKSREFQRFITYVCKANDNVIEIDVKRQTRRAYHVKNGKVSYEDKRLDDKALQFIGLYPEDRVLISDLIERDHVRELARAGGEEYFECRVRMEGQGEAYQWYAFTLQGVPQDAQDEGRLMIFIKNINHAKQAENEKRQALMDALAAAKQAGEAKGAFMSRMSHEIRTPLNAILGYLSIAKSSLDDHGKAGECLEKSEFAAHHLLNIINDVLDISAIESGKMKIAHEPFDVKQLLSSITSIFHAQAAIKGVGFHVRLNSLTEEALVGDQLRLNQILMNLLSNAVKFTSAGGQVTLTIRQKTADKRKVYLQIEVADTGIGMSEEYKERLFQPFEQQDASTAQKYGGTGLGLSITKNLVMMMEGTLDVRTKEGQGTVFTVNLSFDTVGAPGKNIQGPTEFSGLNVLVLYDKNGSYQYIQTLLGRLGVAYKLALSQEETLSEIVRGKAEGKEYDLCLLDWDIPGEAVIELAKQIKAACTFSKPVIAVMAYEAPFAGEAGKAVDEIILKPVFQSSLFNLLSKICRRCIAEEKAGPQVTDFGLEGIRVLLAEDNPMNMEIAMEMLAAYGVVIDGAENGKRAAELFEQSEEGRYQAILMDIQMPVLNGYDAARRIRAGGHPQAGTIPIIALTADAFAEDINRALAAGMNAHVSKPVDFGQLCKILSEWVTEAAPSHEDGNAEFY